MKSVAIFISIFSIFALSTTAAAGDCQTTFDCTKHTFTVIIDIQNSGRTTTNGTIDCGRGSDPADWSYDGTGTIGAPMNVAYAGGSGLTGHQIDINGISGMGVCGAVNGGAKVIHPPVSGGDPTGADSSLGCIHVPKSLISVLESCQGSSLTITGAHPAPSGADSCQTSASSPASPSTTNGPGGTTPQAKSSTATPATVADAPASAATPPANAVACGFQTISGVRKVVYCPVVPSSFQRSNSSAATTIR